MMTMALKRIADVIGARVHGSGVEVTGMTNDSRRVERGNLYCALPGTRRDGHEYVAAAAEAGAAAALVSRPMDVELPQLVVGNVQVAMGQIAAAWRDQLKAVVIGVTGSNGKTTVKEMLADILATQGPTLATSGNYNNEIGVPLTLARLGPSHRFAVIEMGASRPGDIAYLARIAKPEVGILTNAAAAHLEGFGSLEGVARTKGEMFSSLPTSGLAVINADDAYCGLWQSMAEHCRTITFGRDRSAAVSGRFEGGRIVIDTPAGSFDFLPRLPGKHNLFNALAATAAAVPLGVEPADIGSALSALDSLPGRLQTHHHEGWTVIDDTYNANPASLYAGLQVLTEHGGECWLVLGDMAELGPDSDKFHAEMGQTANDMGISRLFTLGSASRRSSLAFGEGAEHFESRDELSGCLAEILRPGVTCLVKGSRSMGMEKVVQMLIGEKA